MNVTAVHNTYRVIFGHIIPDPDTVPGNAKACGAPGIHGDAFARLACPGQDELIVGDPDIAVNGGIGEASLNPYGKEAGGFWLLPWHIQGHVLRVQAGLDKEAVHIPWLQNRLLHFRLG